MKKRVRTFLIIVALIVPVFCLFEIGFDGIGRKTIDTHQPLASSYPLSSSPLPGMTQQPDTGKNLLHPALPEIVYPELKKWPPIKVASFPVTKRHFGERIAYLTFDDGPAPAGGTGVKPTSGTLNLLAILNKHKVRATFFMIGKNVYANPELARQVVADGMVVGNHTWSHVNLYTISNKDFIPQIKYTNEIIFDVTGEHPTVFRSPGGRLPNDYQMNILRKNNLEYFRWNVDSGDWAGDTDQQILKHIQTGINARRDLVILFHDYAFGALDQTIELLQKNRYVFDTLDHFKDFAMPLAGK